MAMPKAFLLGGPLRSMLAVKRRIGCLAFLVAVCIQTVVSPDDGYWKEVGHSFSGLACGLVLLVFHVPEAGVQRNISWCCRIGGCCLVAFLGLYAACYPWHLTPALFPTVTTEHFKKRWLSSTLLVFVTALFILCVFKKHPPSMCAHDSKWCIFGIWLTNMGFMLFEIAKAAVDVAKAVDNHHFKAFALCFSMGMESVVLGWTVATFQSRMNALRVSHSAVPCFNRIWVYIMSGALIANAAFVAMKIGLKNYIASKVASSLFLVLFLSIWATYSVKVSSCLFTGLHLLVLEASRVRGLPRQQTLWAARVLRMEMIICTLLGLTTFFAWAAVLFIRIYELVDQEGYNIIKFTFWHWCGSFRRVDLSINAVCLALLSGILWQGRPPGLDKEDQDFEEKSKIRVHTKKSDGLKEDEKVLYDTKVEQLSSRGIRLRDLLQFWDELLEGQIMPSFDPQQSQTNDVVRQAVIPKARVGSGGVALAKLWAGDDAVVPQSMVTHNWSNTFAHLVAAIVADALEHDTYANTAKHLMKKSGVHTLMYQLNAQNKLHMTYWICCFAVNQHASICDGFGPEPAANTDAWKAWDKSSRDSVSLERFPVCCCVEPKIRGDRDPMNELNKFDDMMAFRQKHTSGFGQLIVVDENFVVFKRAWCVAEMVEGTVLSREGNYTVRVAIFSETSVDVNYDTLSLLDVRNCKAALETDRQYILSKIADPRAFNLKLQHMIFSSQGIFSKWVDGKERSRQVGRIWRRCASVVCDHEAIRPGLVHPQFRKMFSRLEPDSEDSDMDQV